MTECWERSINLDSKGYSRVNLYGHTHKSHRISAVIYLGLDLNSVLFALHKCNNRSCWNPKHLYVGTHLNNMQDRACKGGYRNNGGNNRKKTHCPAGHEYTMENTLYYSGRRRCRVCHNARSRRVFVEEACVQQTQGIFERSAPGEAPDSGALTTEGE